MSEELLSRWASYAFVVGVGFGILLLLAEGWWPRVQQRCALGRRWFANLGTYSATEIALWSLSPLSLFGAALLASQRGWGLFNWVSAPDVVAFTVSWLVLDLVAYVEHRLKHRIPLLWRIHRLHHSDPDVDVTTTLRFHPFEVLLRTAVRGVVATAIGMPPIGAVAYSLLMACVSVLSHANIRQPGLVWRVIGLVVITPDFHRTHHSVDREDCNSNFGLLLSCWDRLFGTYRSAPTLGHENIRFGVEGLSVKDGTSILKMLADPFVPERMNGPSVMPTAIAPSPERRP